MYFSNKIAFHKILESTNEYAKSQIKSLENASIILAATQTRGKGRLNRTWISDTEGNLYASIVLKETNWLNNLTELPILSSILLRRTITERCGENKSIGFKWPNDIWADGKLAGILIETHDEAQIIGIGLNITSCPEIPGKKTDSLTNIYGPSFNPPKTIELAEIINKNMKNIFSDYKNFGFAVFKEEWEKYCIHINKWIYLNESISASDTSSKKIQFLGLNNDGSALVKFENGSKDAIYYGEINDQ